MKNFLRKNFIVLIAFALPLVLISAVALSIYIPASLVSTEYSFIYSSCTDGTNHYYYYCDNYRQKRYSVVEGRLVVNEVDPTLDSDRNGVPDVNEAYQARIFFHDTNKNESREITLEEAQALNLNSLLTSPDGVTVSNNYDRSPEFFPFYGGSSSYGYFLTKGSSKKRLNLINNNDYYYRDNFQFIGWVVPESR